MTDFAYRSIDKSGQIHVGTIVAVDRASAAAELHGRGLTPIEVSSKGKTLSILLNSEVTVFGGTNQRDICSFLRDAARLLKAGLAIDDSLKLLTEMQSKKQFADILQDLREQVRRGESLAAAMSKHSIFTIQVTAAVHAGENAGDLASALSALSQSMDRALTFREKLRSAMIYPSFLISMVVLTFVLVMTFVLPQFEPLFVGNEDKLPWATNFIMSLAKLFEAYSLLLFAILVLAFGGTFLAFRDGHMKDQILRSMCKSKRLAGWLETPDIIRFIRTLGVCTRSGMPLDKALSIAVQAVRLPHISSACAKARSAVRRGETVAACFQRMTWVPSLALQFAMVGEQTGRLGPMLEEASIILAQDYETKLERGLEVLSPVLTLVLGAIVALLVGSVLIGIMSINDVAF